MPQRTGRFRRSPSRVHAFRIAAATCQTNGEDVRARATRRRSTSPRTSAGKRHEDTGRQRERQETDRDCNRNTPIACDVTIVSPLKRNGEARPRAAWEDGAAIRKAEREKERTYHELVNSSRCRLVVLACEVGGRWSETCLQLIHDLAEYRSNLAPPRLRRSTTLAWENRWWGMLSVAMQDSLAATW